MAAAKKKKRLFISTPLGTFVWPHFNEPSFGTEAYPSKYEGGQFDSQLVVDKDSAELASFMDQLQPLLEQAKEWATAKFKALTKEQRVKLEQAGMLGPVMDPIVKDMYHEETEELLPTVKMNFSMGAGGTIKKGDKKGQTWMARPVIMDAKGKRIEMFIDAPGTSQHGKPKASAPKIWSGSMGRMSIEIQVDDPEHTFYFVAATGKYGLQKRLSAVQIVKLASGNERTADQYGFNTDADGYSSEEFSADAPDETVDDSVEQAASPVSGNF